MAKNVEICFILDNNGNMHFDPSDKGIAAKRNAQWNADYGDFIKKIWKKFHNHNDLFHNDLFLAFAQFVWECDGVKMGISGSSGNMFFFDPIKNMKEYNKWANGDVDVEDLLEEDD